MFKLKALWALLPALAILAVGCQGTDEVTGETGGVAVPTNGADTPPAAVSGELEGTYSARFGDLIDESMIDQMEAFIEMVPEEQQAEARADLAAMRAMVDEDIQLILADGNFTLVFPEQAQQPDQTGEYTHEDGVVTIIVDGEESRFTHDAVAATLTPIEDPAAPGSLPETAVFRKQA